MIVVGDVAVDAVDEHRPRRRRVGWYSSSSGGYISGYGIGCDHVGERRRQRPERRDRPLARLGVAGVGDQRQDDELAVVLLRARTASAGRA